MLRNECLNELLRAEYAALDKLGDEAVTIKAVFPHPLEALTAFAQHVFSQRIQVRPFLCVPSNPVNMGNRLFDGKQHKPSFA